MWMDETCENESVGLWKVSATKNAETRCTAPKEMMRLCWFQWTGWKCYQFKRKGERVQIGNREGLIETLCFEKKHDLAIWEIREGIEWSGRKVKKGGKLTSEWVSIGNRTKASWGLCAPKKWPCGVNSWRSWELQKSTGEEVNIWKSEEVEKWREGGGVKTDWQNKLTRISCRCLLSKWQGKFMHDERKYRSRNDFATSQDGRKG